MNPIYYFSKAKDTFPSSYLSSTEGTCLKYHNGNGVAMKKASIEPPQIHLNPKICAPRNIYLNKALVSFLPPATCSFGCERVHYNPKFFNSTVNQFMKQDGIDSFKTNFKKEINIHINPNFISDDKHLACTSKLKAPNVQCALAPSSGTGIHINPIFLKSNSCEKVPNSRGGESMDETPTTSVSSTSPSLLRLVSKYKIVKKKISPSFSKHFSHFMKMGASRYRKNNTIAQRQKKISVIKERLLKNFAKDFNNQKIESISSEFKLVRHNKLVRKSVLQKQIESRRCGRKSTVHARYSNPFRLYNCRKLYKLPENKIARTPQGPAAKRFIHPKKNLKKNGSFSVGIPARYRLRKNLRKVNEPCPFYHRYGHCKRKAKGTCWKAHDPKYVAICKRFLKGQCKDDKCSLSHDIRPEKMPTCHHYLAGLCQRTDCPYLHIRVNPLAPICRAFLQGFCADVFNCSKRHEYICPVFAEKGACPRERRSCPYPHKTVSPLSKLLQADEVPLLTRSRPQREAKRKPSQNTSKHSSDMEYTTKEFKRYFLAPLTDINSESLNINM